jgi:DNA polymerase I-like protein with 3'-5' exonuclease and polymerase domains
LAWKKAEKRRQMVDSILEKMTPDGFVCASYLQLGAESGRMSCIKPNNQQIPRDSEFRQCVEAPDGWVLVDSDFGQMELRLAAAIAKDERMIKAFQDGEDLHSVTAEAIGCSRQIAKSANFGLLYGSGAKGLRNYAGASGIVMSVEEAAEIRNQWLNTYQGIKAWQAQNAQLAESSKGNKWADVRVPLSDMRRYLPGDMNRLTVRCNTPIQGAGAAILKCALGNLWPLLQEAGEDEVKLAACVHDEILLLVREPKANEWAARLKQVMESAEAMWLGDVPPLAEPQVGKRWSEIH